MSPKVPKWVISILDRRSTLFKYIIYTNSTFVGSNRFEVPLSYPFLTVTPLSLTSNQRVFNTKAFIALLWVGGLLESSLMSIIWKEMTEAKFGRERK